MRLHRIVLAALLAFCARGAFAASGDDGSWEAHESAWGGPGETTVASHYGDGSWEAHESAWCGPGEKAVVARVATVAKPASEEFNFGKREYEAKCAGCHGLKGKGDGVNKPFLDHSPPDLTLLATSHGGEFPYDEFYTAVDGRVAEHTDMPCFARIYMEAARSDYMDVPYDEDRYMDTRLVALADYVEDLQLK